MEKYVVLEKAVGQTPLECAEAWREAQPPAYRDVPLAYAGRLDPMASGKLLILIGEECKRQEQYHGLDKEYRFEVLFGVGSDSGDVLGIVTTSPTLTLNKKTVQAAAHKLIGPIDLPYPHYSSKTVNGKPLHTWAIEGRLNEIEIPTKSSVIYSLACTDLREINSKDLKNLVHSKVESIPPVTDPRKAIGNDFRRPQVREAWENIFSANPDKIYQIATFTCVASSGTYMRTLAEVIAKSLGTTGLAFSIHRKTIGVYNPVALGLGFWRRRYR